MVKLLVVEEGSETAAELWNSEHPAATSILAYPEGRAALAAARRSGRLTEVAHGRASGEFEDLTRALISVGVDEQLAHQAGQLAEDLELRGYDAVHLATALALDEDIVLASWDADLNHAAERVGLAVAGG